MSRWSKWSPCSVTCNEGTQTRTRVCNPPRGFPHHNIPYHMRIYCNGLKERNSRICYREPCQPQGHFGEWSHWGPCSVTCGHGIRKRKRNCYGSFDCDILGPLEDEEACPDLPNCHGTYDQWSEWTTCSVTCGRGGTKVRTRECLGQYSCVGRNVDWKTCDNIPCKGKMRKRRILIFVFTKFVILGKLSQWSGWSQCSTSSKDLYWTRGL